MISNINKKNRNRSKKQSKKQTRKPKQSVRNRMGHKSRVLSRKKTVYQKATSIVMIKKDKLEFLLLFTILFNYYVMLVLSNTPNSIRIARLNELITKLRDNNKIISKDTTNTQITNIAKQLNDFFNKLVNMIDVNMIDVNTIDKIGVKYSRMTRKRHQDGGFYFKSLEEKGQQPITGEDLTKLLDEMQQFFYNAKYTEEGKFLVDTDALISMLRGDVNQFKALLQYRIFPQYYNAMPPFIKWDAIYNDVINKKKWEDLPDYLLAYQSYLRSRDEYMVEKGLKPPSALQKDLYTGFYNNLANSINDNMYTFQQYRNKAQGRLFPIAVPV